MFDLAKLIRTDRGLKIDETGLRAEVTRVVDLEKDIASVSIHLFFQRSLKLKCDAHYQARLLSLLR